MRASSVAYQPVPALVPVTSLAVGAQPRSGSTSRSTSKPPTRLLWFRAGELRERGDDVGPGLVVLPRVVGGAVGVELRDRDWLSTSTTVLPVPTWAVEIDRPRLV